MFKLIPLDNRIMIHIRCFLAKRSFRKCATMFKKVALPQFNLFLGDIQTILSWMRVYTNAWHTSLKTNMSLLKLNVLEVKFSLFLKLTLADYPK